MGGGVRGGESFLSAIFNAVLVQVVTNRSTPLKNTVTIDISFESFFFTIFFLKNAL